MRGFEGNSVIPNEVIMIIFICLLSQTEMNYDVKKKKCLKALTKVKSFVCLYYHNIVEK